MREFSAALANRVLVAIAAVALSAGIATAKTRVTFYYPVQVSGPLTQVIDGYAQKFMAANPDIEVVPVYSGNYIDTTTKALTAAKSGTPPTVAVLLATDIYTLLDEDVIQPLDVLHHGLVGDCARGTVHSGICARTSQ